MNGEFQALIDHAGWQAAASEGQGVDERQRIIKDGVVFSALRVQPSDRATGQVALDPLPQWAAMAELPCEVSAKELCDRFSIDAKSAGCFGTLDSRLADLKSYLGGSEFARSKLRHEIEMLPKKYKINRQVIRQWRSEIGIFRVIKGTLQSKALERRWLTKYRRALAFVDRDRE